MTKQEKILDWINKYLTEQFIGGVTELPSDECRNEAKAILLYLQSQGGRLKVDRAGEIKSREVAAVEPLISV